MSAEEKLFEIELKLRKRVKYWARHVERDATDMAIWCYAEAKNAWSIVAEYI